MLVVVCSSSEVQDQLELKYESSFLNVSLSLGRMRIFLIHLLISYGEFRTTFAMDLRRLESYSRLIACNCTPFPPLMILNASGANILTCKLME